MFFVDDRSIKNRVVVELVAGPMLKADGTVTYDNPIPRLRSLYGPTHSRIDSVQNLTTFEGTSTKWTIYELLHEANRDVLAKTAGGNEFIGRRNSSSYNCHRIFKGTDIDYDNAGEITTEGYNYYGLYNTPAEAGVNCQKMTYNNRTIFSNFDIVRNYLSNVITVNLIIKDSENGRFPINYFNIRSITQLGDDRPRIAAEPGDYKTNKVNRYFTVGDEGYWLIQYCDKTHTFSNIMNRNFTVWNPAIEIPEAYKDMNWQIVSWEIRSVITDV